MFIEYIMLVFIYSAVVYDNVFEALLNFKINSSYFLSGKAKGSNEYTYSTKHCIYCWFDKNRFRTTLNWLDYQMIYEI